MSTTTGRAGSKHAFGGQAQLNLHAVPAALGLVRAFAQVPFDHVEAEHAAFDGAVPHRHAARFFQAHLAGQLEVRREHPGRPAAVVLFQCGGQLGEEFATIVGYCAASRPTLAPRARSAARSLALRPAGTGGGNALAVGRVQQHHTGLLARRHALQGIATAQLHGTRHARALGVALGKVHHAVGHITAKNGYRAFTDCAVSFVLIAVRRAPGTATSFQTQSGAACPAGMRPAICAASTTMVPLPQQGRTRAGVLAV